MPVLVVVLLNLLAGRLVVRLTGMRELMKPALATRTLEKFVMTLLQQALVLRVLVWTPRPERREELIPAALPKLQAVNQVLLITLLVMKLAVVLAMRVKPAIRILLMVWLETGFALMIIPARLIMYAMMEARRTTIL